MMEGSGSDEGDSFEDEITDMYKTQSITNRSHSNSLTSLLAASDEEEEQGDEEASVVEGESARVK